MMKLKLKLKITFLKIIFEMKCFNGFYSEADALCGVPLRERSVPLCEALRLRLLLVRLPGLPLRDLEPSEKNKKIIERNCFSDMF